MEKETQFLDSFSEEVWRTTYKDHKDNNINDTFRRVAKAIASVEKTEELKTEWEEKFYDLLTDFKVTVGGRIYANAGIDFKGTSLINCFVGPKAKYDEDSIDGIYQNLLFQTKTLKSEGGWGMNFSFIRPRGAFIHGIGVESPGSVKYMELFDKSSEIITAGSGKKSSNIKAKGKIRKGAMMGVLYCWHPDVEEFIDAKLTEGKLSKFNLSVACTNKFMDLICSLKAAQERQDEQFIKNNDKWDLIFPDTTFKKYKSEWNGNIESWINKSYPIIIYKTISAIALWNKIMMATYTRNDPGVLFLDIANKTHCWNYGGEKSEIHATNPCGEQCLPYGLTCNLASLNLVKFINKDKTGFDLDKIKKYSSILTRFSDNVNDYSQAPLEEYSIALKKARRIGIGVLGWGSSLYLMKTRFGSTQAEKIKHELLHCLTKSVINTSIDLAREKGMFEYCDPVKHSEAYFWKQIQLDQSIINKISKYGIRNSALFSIQPTGNTSILANIVSGGLEPVFLHEYIRTVIVSECPEDIKDIVPKYWEGDYTPNDYFIESKEGHDNILIYEHTDGTKYKIDRNRGLTKEVLCQDYAVRNMKLSNEWDSNADWAVTTNNLSVKDHITDMSGWGKWIDSSMSKTVNLPNDYSYEEFNNLYINAYKTGFLKGITTYRAGTMTTVLSAKSNKKCIDDFKKRDKELNCDIYHCKVKGEEYFCLVGINKCGNPYEVFAGKNGVIPKNIDKGIIHRQKRGHYQLFSNEELILDNITNHLTDDGEALTRLISMALRHSVGLPYVLQQLEKVEGDLFILSKAIARCLKKYVSDGTPVSGESCGECGQASLIRQSGCIVCSSCGWSKC